MLPVQGRDQLAPVKLRRGEHRGLDLGREKTTARWGERQRLDRQERPPEHMVDLDLDLLPTPAEEKFGLVPLRADR